MKTLTRYAVKTPEGYLSGIDGKAIESCQTVNGAEWYHTMEMARCVARFALGCFPKGKRFQVYPFKFTVKLVHPAKS